MAAGLVIGSPAAEPVDVPRVQVLAPGVTPRLRQRLVDRPAIDGVSHQGSHEPRAVSPCLAVDVDGPVVRVADEGEERLRLGFRGGLLSLERQRQVVLEPGPFGRLVVLREEAEVDDGPDAMIAEPGPSGLVPGLTGAREPLLPDHPVARNGRRRLPSGSTRHDSSREPFSSAPAAISTPSATTVLGLVIVASSLTRTPAWRSRGTAADAGGAAASAPTRAAMHAFAFRARPRGRRCAPPWRRRGGGRPSPPRLHLRSEGSSRSPLHLALGECEGPLPDPRDAGTVPASRLETSGVRAA